MRIFSTARAVLRRAVSRVFSATPTTTATRAKRSRTSSRAVTRTADTAPPRRIRVGCLSSDVGERPRLRRSIARSGYTPCRVANLPAPCSVSTDDGAAVARIDPQSVVATPAVQCRTFIIGGCGLVDPRIQAPPNSTTVRVVHGRRRNPRPKPEALGPLVQPRQDVVAVRAYDLGDTSVCVVSSVAIVVGANLRTPEDHAETVARTNDRPAQRVRVGALSTIRRRRTACGCSDRRSLMIT